jgi:hypothetical protein
MQKWGQTPITQTIGGCHIVQDGQWPLMTLIVEDSNNLARHSYLYSIGDDWE